MWGNFAKKLGEVVAPPPDDEYEEEVEEDDGEYSYEEEEEEYEDVDEHESRGGFNFVSMIARAMDTEQHRYEVESTSQSNLNYHDGGGIIDQSERQGEDDEVEIDFVTTNVAVHDFPEHGKAVPFSTEESSTSQSNSCKDREHDTTGYTEDETIPDPPRMALIRESGSLSPQRRASKPSIGTTILDVSLNNGNTTAKFLPDDDDDDHELDDDHDDKNNQSHGSSENHLQNQQVTSKTADPLLGNFSGMDMEHRINTVDRTASEERFKPCSTDVGPVSPLRKYKYNVSDASLENAESMSADAMIAKATDGTTSSKKINPMQKDVVVQNSNSSSIPPAQKHNQLPSIPFLSEEETHDNGQQTKEQPDHHHQVQNGSTESHPIQSKPLLHNDETSSADAVRIAKLEKRCKELRKQLTQAENHILELQKQATTILEQDNSEHEQMMKSFQEKEARLLQAAAEDHEQEMNLLRNEMEERYSIMQNQLIGERKEFEEDQGHMETLLKEANARGEMAERKWHEEKKQSEKSVLQLQQQHSRAIRMAEDKLAQTLAILDEREESIMQLKAKIKTLESKMSEHHEGAQEAEEEMDELHAENETLQNQVQALQTENHSLREKVSNLQGDAEKLSHLKMELRMLKEENEREKARAQNVAISAESNSAQLLSERDEMNAKIHDLRLQLAAALADVEVARSDAERIMMANGNLQAALEAFQNEREAELAMIENNQREQEKALAAAHAVALEATRETHRLEIRQIQEAADAAVKNSMDEIKLLEEKIEMMRIENVQTRRSLDEAIKRLQATQDDVVDRTFMKNILLDWLTKTEKKERSQVLELMASVLHFTDDEKQRVHIDDGGGIRKFVAPPPPKADMEHLEGDNVREKWVNFLIAETED